MIFVRCSIVLHFLLKLLDLIMDANTGLCADSKQSDSLYLDPVSLESLLKTQPGFRQQITVSFDLQKYFEVWFSPKLCDHLQRESVFEQIGRLGIPGFINTILIEFLPVIPDQKKIYTQIVLQCVMRGLISGDHLDLITAMIERFEYLKQSKFEQYFVIAVKNKNIDAVKILWKGVLRTQAVDACNILEKAAILFGQYCPDKENIWDFLLNTYQQLTDSPNLLIMNYALGLVKGNHVEELIALYKEDPELFEESFALGPYHDPDEYDSKMIDILVRHAAIKNNEAIIDFLLAHGADLHSMFFGFGTALEMDHHEKFGLSKTQHHPETCAMFMKYVHDPRSDKCDWDILLDTIGNTMNIQLMRTFVENIPKHAPSKWYYEIAAEILMKYISNKRLCSTSNAELNATEKNKRKILSEIYKNIYIEFYKILQNQKSIDLTGFVREICHDFSAHREIKQFHQ